MKKAKIQVSIASWNPYELDGRLADCIVKLQSLIRDNPNCFDFIIDVESESGYYGSCSTNIHINAFRWETNDEFESRKNAAKEAAVLAKIEEKRKIESQKKRERSLYESLKRKFEKEIEETNPKQ